MNTTTTRREFLRSTTLMTGITCFAAVPRLRAQQDTEGWMRLFDGTTLAGWHKNRQKIGHGTGGDWRVEDGAIVGQQDPPGSGNGGILLTDATFGDFELSIDMKPDWGVCSGLFLRGNERGQCFQMMVDYHDAGNVGHLYGEGLGGFQTRTFDINGKYDDQKNLIGLSTANEREAQEMGLIESCRPEEWLRVWRIDDWNTAVVRVEGGPFPLITTSINGLKICQFDGNTSTAEKYDKLKTFEQLGRQGSIAVQVHGGTGWPDGAKCRWRNIRIRALA